MSRNYKNANRDFDVAADGLRVFLARFEEGGSSGGIDEYRYFTFWDASESVEQVRHTENKRQCAGSLRVLSFDASPFGAMPANVFIHEQKDRFSSLSSICHALRFAAGKKAGAGSGIGFLADAAFASEKIQVELAARISSLLFRRWEELAAMPWAHFEMLAVEMTQKGLTLVVDGWIGEESGVVFNPELVPLFSEIVEALKRKRPELGFCGIIRQPPCRGCGAHTP